MHITKTRGIYLAGLWLLFASLPVLAENRAVTFPPVPSTISPQAKQALSAFQTAVINSPMTSARQPAPDDIDGWRSAQEGFIHMTEGINTAVLAHILFRQERGTIGGVPVLTVTPEGWKPDGRVLVYVHGGGYVFGSAASSLPAAALAARATGMRVISIDYTVAPQAKWREATGQVVAVLDGLRHNGIAPSATAVFGDSAGGGLAAGSLLRMRDEGKPLPAALVLWSPWADITESGDTYHTLRDVDFLKYEQLASGALAYASAGEQMLPYVSPVYGDYRKGFPPTLIQGGTREIFLSGFVRLYQSMDTAGQQVKLDIYEGMPHVFQVLLAGTPEATSALDKMASFIHSYLAKTKTR